MSFVKEFGKKISSYINQGFNEFISSGYEENTIESIEFILISKPLLRIMMDFEPDEKEKAHLEHSLTYKKLGSLERILSSQLKPLKMIIKRGYQRVSEGKMIESIYYSEHFNKLINRVYEALRYKNNEEQIPENHQWLQKP
ncbi:hypothetical protein GF352_01425 [archaeon]|nr:hypothetical protein [archaeon]